MKLIQSVVVVMGALFFSSSILAGVYKCSDELGNTSYQANPCAEEKTAAEINVKTGGVTDLSIEQRKKEVLARHLAVHDRFWDSCRKNRFTARRINRLQTPCVRIDYAQKPLRQYSHKWLDGYSG